MIWILNTIWIIPKSHYKYFGRTTADHLQEPLIHRYNQRGFTRNHLIGTQFQNFASSIFKKGHVHFHVLYSRALQARSCWRCRLWHLIVNTCGLKACTSSQLWVATKRYSFFYNWLLKQNPSNWTNLICCCLTKFISYFNIQWYRYFT